MENGLSEKMAVLDPMLSALKGTQGVAAIVLGGSYAAGYASEGSDLDIGLYYFEKAPFEVGSIRGIANSFSSQGSPVVTGFYEWGPWVNGGAWITTAAGKVDLLYRNIDQVQHTVTDAVNGTWHHNFDQQPPYGFRSVIYLAEIRICKPLFDPGHVVQKLKEQVVPYPVKLKHTILSDCLWMAEFTLMHGYHFARSADIYNTLGCFTRIANYLVHALFAINEAYPLGDKRALQLIKTFDNAPSDMESTLNGVLSEAGARPRELIASTDRLKGLWEQIVTLTGGHYKPRFATGKEL